MSAAARIDAALTKLAAITRLGASMAPIAEAASMFPPVFAGRRAKVNKTAAIQITKTLPARFGGGQITRVKQPSGKPMQNPVAQRERALRGRSAEAGASRKELDGLNAAMQRADIYRYNTPRGPEVISRRAMSPDLIAHYARLRQTDPADIHNRVKQALKLLLAGGAGAGATYAATR